MFTEALEPGFKLNDDIINAQALIPMEIGGHTLNALGFLTWHLDFVPDGIEGGFLLADIFFRYSSKSGMD
uniref:Uncharacterized protein n=1 Tax=Parascaris equorum TaxID=6256 RepID=A0A914R5T6_PAREQ